MKPRRKIYKLFAEELHMNTDNNEKSNNSNQTTIQSTIKDPRNSTSSQNSIEEDVVDFRRMSTTDRVRNEFNKALSKNTTNTTS